MSLIGAMAIKCNPSQTERQISAGRLQFWKAFLRRDMAALRRKRRALFGFAVRHDAHEQAFHRHLRARAGVQLLDDAIKGRGEAMFHFHGL